MVKHGKFDIFASENNLSLKKLIIQKKTVVKYADNTWSLHLLDMIDNRLKNNGGFRYNSVLIDKFGKCPCGTSLEKKSSQKYLKLFRYYSHFLNKNQV